MNPSLWISKKKKKKKRNLTFDRKREQQNLTFKIKKESHFREKNHRFQKKKKDISLSKEKTDSWFLSKTESHWKSLKSLDDSVKNEVLVCFQEI